jgi:hypothetical protein
VGSAGEDAADSTVAADGATAAAPCATGPTAAVAAASEQADSRVVRALRRVVRCVVMGTPRGDRRAVTHHGSLRELKSTENHNHS